MHSNTNSPNKAKKWKNCKKWQKMTENCKISEITTYGEQITKIDKSVKQCKKMPKTGLKRPKKIQISEILFSSFFWLETT